MQTKDKTLMWYTFTSAAVKLVQKKPWTLRMNPVLDGNCVCGGTVAHNIINIVYSIFHYIG